MRIRHLILPIVMSLSAFPATAGVPLTSCHVPDVKEAVLCGTLRVPENRSLNGGRQIPLQVVVLSARKKPAKEPVFFFAGGPGQPATETAPGFAHSWIREEHDVVLLDQRGTGKGNRLDCLVGGSNTNPQDYIEPLFFHGARYDDCVKDLSKKADLTQYTTVASMRDADDLRRALGYDKIDVYGGSYGTRAGIVYLRMFSKNVRLAVLSGIDPISDRGPLNHAAAAQQAFDTLAEQCADDAACHHAFDPKADLAAILAQLRKSPVPVTIKNPKTGKSVSLRMTVSAFGDGLRVMLYDEGMGRSVPLLLHAARAGDFTPFAEVAFEHSMELQQDVAMGLLLSVSCTEDVSRIRPEEVAPATAGKFIGDYRVRGQMAACASWPKGEVPKDYEAPFTVNTPVLLVSGKLDPVTPAKWSEEAARYFPNSLSILVPGAHVSDSACLDSIMKQFVQSGSLKGLNTSCIAQMKLPPFALKKS